MLPAMKALVVSKTTGGVRLWILKSNPVGSSEVGEKKRPVKRRSLSYSWFGFALVFHAECIDHEVQESAGDDLAVTNPEVAASIKGK